MKNRLLLTTSIVINILILCSFAKADTFIVQDQQGLALNNAVLEFSVSNPVAETVSPPNTLIMDQIDKLFKPDVLVINQGDYVNFPNSDDIRHHVYSFSSVKPFELKLYSGRPKAPLQFNTAGVAVLGCNIHDSMVGYIYIASSSQVLQTDEQGMATLDDAIKYQSVNVWHASSVSSLKKITYDELSQNKNNKGSFVIELVVDAPEPRNTFQSIFKKMASKLTLRRQITLLGVSLVILTVASLLSVSMWKTITTHDQQIDQRITSAENVLIEYLKAKEELLLTASKVLTADFGFKQAVASRDQGTIASVLENHSSRINASLMILSDLNGQIISSSNNKLSFDSSLTERLITVKENLNKTQLMLLGGNLYQLIILPVEAPRTIAYSLIGFQIDQAFVNDLKRLMAVDVSFFYNEAIIITTLQQVKSDHFNKMDKSWLLFERKLYENKQIVFTNSQDHKYVAQLSVDLVPSYIELDKLVSITLFISLLIIIITAIACSFIARNLTKPLFQLTRLTRDFAQGKYEHNGIMSVGSVEVLRVYTSFIKMGRKIQKRENKISYQAKHDSLTNVYNRATFLDVLSKHIENHVHDAHKSLLIMAINVRHFKRINDSLGSEIGDITLSSVAQRMKDIYPDKTLMVGRFSGTEFCVVINLESGENYKDIIDDYLTQLRAPLQVNKLRLNLNFRIGTCLFPQKSSNAKEIIRRTTIALEAARSENISLRAYQDGEDEAYLERLNLLEELREALNRDSGELFMVYQPKLNLNNGKIEKVESLIRWIKPDGQFISPELFIDLAEQSGLIIKLTHWVIDSVFKQQQEWQANKLKLKVAINISAQDISHADFIDFIFEKMSQYNVESHLITLEITERDIMTNEDLVIRRLKQLKQTGIQISVDDYGIGQSSLSKLKQLPIDELKIDKAFILELDKSEKDQFIVQSTIKLSHQLGLSVVAEGVENKASLDMLKVMKCNHVQGYFISRPIKSAELLTWLNAYE